MITTIENKNFSLKEMQCMIDALSVIYMETLKPQDPLVGGRQSNLSSDDIRCSIIKLSDRIHGTKNHIDSIMKIENEIL